MLIWTTVNPKEAKGFLYSLRKWAHIALLPSTKVFLQQATKLLDMAPVFYFFVSMTPLKNLISCFIQLNSKRDKYTMDPK